MVASGFPLDDLAAFLLLNQLAYRGAARPADWFLLLLALVILALIVQGRLRS
jgi:hypothetical protein